MIKVNLNDYVKFKLTDKGNLLLEQYRVELSKLVGNEVPKDVYLKLMKMEMNICSYGIS